MLNYFRDILSSANSQDAGSIKLLRIMLTAATLALFGLALMLGIINRGKIGVGSGGSILMASVAALALWFSYRNIHWPGRLIFPFMALAGISFLAISTDGLHDSTVMAFTLVILFASLLIGQKVIPLATLFTLAAIWLVAYTDMSGINQSLFARNTKVSDAIGIAVVYSIIQIIAAASLNGLLSRLNSAIEITKASEQAQIKANQELRDLQITLEERVAERTAIAEKLRTESEAARRDTETQRWLATGQAQLAEQMRGELGLTALANNVVQYVCRYLGAQTGVLFLAKGETLHLTGRYAYVERPGAKDTLRFGEGLLGQAARDKRMFILDQLPADAPLVASSLGDARPRQLLIAPLEIEGQVIGVLELATLQEFTLLHQTFLGRCSESIAIAFRTSQARERIATLLEESQRQAEELQAQEEELRAANEELQAQTENLKSRNKG